MPVSTASVRCQLHPSNAHNLSIITNGNIQWSKMHHWPHPAILAIPSTPHPSPEVSSPFSAVSPPHRRNPQSCILLSACPHNAILIKWSEKVSRMGRRNAHSHIWGKVNDHICLVSTMHILHMYDLSSFGHLPWSAMGKRQLSTTLFRLPPKLKETCDFILKLLYALFLMSFSILFQICFTYSRWSHEKFVITFTSPRISALFSITHNTLFWNYYGIYVWHYLECHFKYVHCIVPVDIVIIITDPFQISPTYLSWSRGCKYCQSLFK